MATLLMRFDAPMQAWGTQSDFGHRDTGLEPSKSGVVGLIGAALGRPRNADFSDLAALRMGVRVEREGVVKRDYHTVGRDGYYKIGTGIEKNNVMISERFYLADALFLVGLEGNKALLMQLQAALQSPVYPLFMGRKAFPPACPLWLEDGLRDEDLLTSLKTYRLKDVDERRLTKQRKLVIEDPNGSIIRRDQPISFTRRRFMPRRIFIEFVSFNAEHSEE